MQTTLFVSSLLPAREVLAEIEERKARKDKIVRVAVNMTKLEYNPLMPSDRIIL